MKAEIASLQQRAETGRQIILQASLEPNQRKEPLVFSAGRAAGLLGVTTASIGQVLQKKSLGTGLDIESGRYNLDQATYEELRKHYEQAPRRRTRAKILTVSNQKGGVGKTTTVVHLAPYLALQGLRCLVVDGDSQGSYSSYQSLIPDRDLDEEHTISPILSDARTDDGRPIPLRHLVERVIRKSPNIENLWFIPACLELANGDIAAYRRQLTSKPGDTYSFYNRLYLALETVRDNFDVILIDCPPHISATTWNSVYTADMIVVPLGAHMLDFSSTMRFIDWMDTMLEDLPYVPLGKIRFLITNYHSNSEKSSSGTMASIIRDVLGDSVMKSMALHSSEVQRASADLKSIYELGRSIGDKRAYARACKSMDEVNAEILEALDSVRPYTLQEMQEDMRNEQLQARAAAAAASPMTNPQIEA